MFLDSLKKLCQCQGDPALIKPLTEGDKKKILCREEALDEVVNEVATEIAIELQRKHSKLAKALGPFRDLKVGCSDGKGDKAYIPWVRIYSEKMAPKPTKGYFVDFLPTWDKKLYIGIIPGVSCSNEERDERQKWARGVLGGDKAIVDRGFLLRICLKATGGAYPKKYEKAIVLAKKFDVLNTIDENSLLKCLRECLFCQLEQLACIYKKEARACLNLPEKRPIKR